jgi:hypothetical protein
MVDVAVFVVVITIVSQFSWLGTAAVATTAKLVHLDAVGGGDEI